MMLAHFHDSDIFEKESILCVSCFFTDFYVKMKP